MGKPNNFFLFQSGECWSGAPNTYNESNFVSTNSCIGEHDPPCEALDRHCVGPQWTNFVFEIGKKCRFACLRGNLFPLSTETQGLQKGCM